MCGKCNPDETIHGSALGIAGKGIANPLGTILSSAMLLRHSFQLEEEAAWIERSVKDVLAAGHRTRDLAEKGAPSVSTEAMGNLVLEAMRSPAVRA